MNCIVVHRAGSIRHLGTLLSLRAASVESHYSRVESVSDIHVMDIRLPLMTSSDTLIIACKTSIVDRPFRKTNWRFDKPTSLRATSNDLSQQLFASIRLCPDASCELFHFGIRNDFCCFQSYGLLAIMTALSATFGI